MCSCRAGWPACAASAALAWRSPSLCWQCVFWATAPVVVWLAEAQPQGFLIPAVGPRPLGISSGRRNSARTRANQATYKPARWAKHGWLGPLSRAQRPCPRSRAQRPWMGTTQAPCMRLQAVEFGTVHGRCAAPPPPCFDASACPV